MCHRVEVILVTRETCIVAPCKEKQTEKKKKKEKKSREEEWLYDERLGGSERMRVRTRERGRKNAREREKKRKYNITLASIFYERVFYKIHTISVYLVASRLSYESMYVCYTRKRWYESLDVFLIRHRSLSLLPKKKKKTFSRGGRGIINGCKIVRCKNRRECYR